MQFERAVHDHGSALGRQRTPQAKDKRLQRVRRAAWRLLLPHIIDQAIPRDRGVRAQQQYCQQRPQVRTVNRHRLTVTADFERAEHTELEICGLLRQ